jgi:hypothetical protein
VPESRALPEYTPTAEIRRTTHAGAAFHDEFPAGVRDWAPFLFQCRKGKFEMKTFVAACIAIGILWAVDVEFNDGRYSTVVQRALKGILAHRS